MSTAFTKAPDVVGASKTLAASRYRISVQNQKWTREDEARVLSGRHAVGHGDSYRTVKNGTAQVTAEKKALEALKIKNPLTAYDQMVIGITSDLEKDAYKLTNEQLDALMGSGYKLPERETELTLTIGSRSARRVSPTSSQLTLGSYA